MKYLSKYDCICMFTSMLTKKPFIQKVVKRLFHELSYINIYILLILHACCNSLEYTRHILHVCKVSIDPGLSIHRYFCGKPADNGRCIVKLQTYGTQQVYGHFYIWISIRFMGTVTNLLTLADLWTLSVWRQLCDTPANYLNFV